MLFRQPVRVHELVHELFEPQVVNVALDLAHIGLTELVGDLLVAAGADLDLVDELPDQVLEL